MCGIVSLAMLILCWWLADWEVRTKIIVTLIYLGLWGLIFIDGWALFAGHAIFALVVGAFTFAGKMGR